MRLIDQVFAGIFIGVGILVIMFSDDLFYRALGIAALATGLFGWWRCFSR